MKKSLRIFASLLTLLLSTLSISVMAQAPANDECATALDLGPNYFNFCSTTGQAGFTNLNATATVFTGCPSCMPPLAPVANPPCWSGQNNRDVWYHFQTDVTNLNVLLTIKGGSGIGLIKQPQVAIYRAGLFGCPSSVGDEELICKRAAPGSNQLTLELAALDPASDYYIRVNDYASTAAGNPGAFSFCMKPLITVVGDPGTTITACDGVALDGGGHAGRYGLGDAYVFTINPPGSGCLSFVLDSLNLAAGDNIKFYNGVNTLAPRLTPVAGLTSANNTNSPINYLATSGAITIEFNSDFSAEGFGYMVHWACAADCASINPCSAQISDPGGPAAPYAGGLNVVRTYCPDALGKRMNIVFNNVDLPTGDLVEVFDGNTTGATTLGSFDNTINGGLPGGQISFAASVSNTQGCLTVRFTSNTDGAQGAGYIGQLSCTKPCQLIVPRIELSTANPAIAAGDSAVNVCVGSGFPVSIGASATFPQSGVIYPQSDASAVYKYEWGDGAISYSIGAPAPHTVSHFYTTPGIYYVYVTVADADTLCGVKDVTKLRVRVAATPRFTGTIAGQSTICLGQTVPLNATGTVGGGGPVGSVVTTTITSVPPTSVAGQFCLPDRPAGVITSYTDTITMTGLVGGVMTAACGLRSINMNLQHSFIGDLSIDMICPNGQSVNLLPYPNLLGGTFFGQANDQASTCTEVAQGADYSWTNVSPLHNYTMTNATAANGGIANLTNNFNPPGSVTTPATLTTGSYLPQQSLANFAGCPYNGNWIIKVTDNQSIDNGIMYSWGIAFDPCAYPNVESYTPILGGAGWLPNPDIISTGTTPSGGQTVSILPTTLGPNTYSYRATYANFPCTFDTTITVNVVPSPTLPTTLKDTSICAATNVALVASAVAACPPMPTFALSPNAPIPDSGVNTNNFVNSVMAVTGVQCNGSTLGTGVIIDRVCLNIPHTWDSDLDIYLVGPNGTQIELSTDNGGASANYTNTCFTATATTSITVGTAPFTGNFIPEQPFSTFNGLNPDGNWTLRVGDDVGGDTGTLVNWSILFLRSNSTSYLWSPGGATTSAITVSPAATTTYTVTATSLNGCSVSRSVVVNVGSIAAPAITCSGITASSVTYNWNTVSGATSYEVSLNGGATWIPATAGTTYTSTGNAANTAVPIQVRGVGACSAAVASQSCSTLSTCTAMATATPTQLTCGQNNGSILAATTNTTAPVTYAWNTVPGQNTATATSLAAGTYTVTATDAVGCTATASATINPKIIPTPSITAPSAILTCTTTAITLTATGGDTYSWSNFSTANTATASAVGTYTVTATLASSGCTAVSTFAVTQNIVPPTPTITSPTTVLTCTTTSIDLTAAGGDTYAWSNSTFTNPTSVNAVGTYTVTATTTANGCTATATEAITQDISQPAPIITPGALNATCAVPTITLTATGGDSYVWFNGAITTSTTNFNGGTFTVTATKASTGCTAIATITVGNAPLPTATISATQNPTCAASGNNGQATVTGTTGTAPYSYLWDNGVVTATVTNLNAGTHTVTVTDASGCSSITSVTLVAPVVQTVTLTTIANTCGLNNGSLTSNVVGGSGNFTYFWNGGITTPNRTGLGAGNYNVIVTDVATRCTASASATLVPTTAPAVTLSAQQPTCAVLGTLTANASNGLTPYTYAWSNGAITTMGQTGLAPNTYTVTVTAGTCTTTASATLVAPPVVTAIITAQANPKCFGVYDGSATVTASGGNGTLTYFWDNSVVTATNTTLSAGTHTVQVTDANTCTATATVTLVDPTEITATTTSANVKCFGDANGTATVNAVGGTGTLTYSWNTTPVQNTATAINLAPGTYTCVVTDANLCQRNYTAFIGGPGPLVAFPVSGAVNCFGGNNGTVSVSATGGTSPYTYVWSVLPPNTTPGIGNLISGNYTVTVTDANMCSLTASANVGSPGALVLYPVSGTTKCFGGNDGTVSVSATGGTAPYAYLWNAPAPNTTPGIGNLTSGNYTVTVTDIKGCTTTANANVGSPGVLVIYPVSGVVKCFGGNDGTVSVSATGGTAPYTYLWNAPAPNTTPGIGNLTSGNYTVTVTDVNMCTITANANVGSPGALVLYPVSGTVKCFGGNDGTVSVSATGGIAPYTYLWNTPAPNTTPGIGSLASGSYTVIITDANMCTTTASANVGSPGALIAYPVSGTVKCFGGSDGTVSVSTTGGIAPYTYLWNTPVPNTTPSIGSLASGNYTVIITDANMCTTTAGANVGSPGALIAYPVSGTVKCFGGNDGTVSVSATGGTAPYTYVWSVPAPNITSSIGNLTSGNYTVTVTDANMCSVIANANIGSAGALVAYTVSGTVKCFGESNGTVSVSAGNGTAPYTYSWSTATPNITPIVGGLAEGNYTVTVTDANMCSVIANANVGSPGALVSYPVSGMVSCFGGSDGGVSVTSGGGVGPYTYLWNTQTANNTPAITSLAIGIYTVTVTDSKGCSLISSTYVGGPGPLTLLPTSGVVRCFGGNDGTVSVVAGSGTSPYTYLWSVPTSNNTPSLNGLTQGIYTVTVTDSKGCSLVSSSVVGSPGLLTVNAGRDTTLFIGSNLILNATNITGGNYVWTSSETGTVGNSNPLLVVVNTSGTYTVLVTNANGCTATDNLVVTAQPRDNNMPNVFTPNSDGMNDKFYIVGDGIEVQEFRVFNRWGQEIYNAAQPWDGKFLGEDQPMDTYVYAIIYKVNAEVVKKSGDFLLAR